MTEDQALGVLEASIKHMAKGTGRPTAFKLDTVKEILARLGGGETLTAICEDDHMPSRVTVWYWGQAHPPFANLLERVRTGAWTDSLVDQALDRALAASDKEEAACARVVAETALKVAGRANPQRWGERGNLTGGVNVQIVTPLFGEDMLNQDEMVIDLGKGKDKQE